MGDGWIQPGRRGRGSGNRNPDRDLASFLRDTPEYQGTAEQFDRAHARRYGPEEGMGPDGMHRPGHRHFPAGSDRQQRHAQYSASTNARNIAYDAYDHMSGEARTEFEEMDDKQQAYYIKTTDGLRPDQHERLDPAAGEWRNKSYKQVTDDIHSEEIY